MKQHKKLGELSPQIIGELSEEWNIPINFMFISSPATGSRTGFPTWAAGG